MAAGNSLPGNAAPTLKNGGRSKDTKDAPEDKTLEDHPAATSQMIPVVVWAFRLYGIELCAKTLTTTKRVIMACLKVLTVGFLSAILVIYGIFIVDGISNAAQSFLLFGVVPMVGSVMSSIISYITVIRKREKIVQLFEEVCTSLATVFGTGSAAIRKEMKRLECFVLLGFAFAFGMQMGQRLTIIYEPQENNQLLAKIENFTVVLHLDYLVSSPLSWSFQWMLIHIHIFDVLAVSLLLVLCRLMCLAFRRIHSALQEPETNGARCSSKEFYALHREACALVVQAENIFAPFLLTWSATQTLTACFWIRSMKLFYMHSAKLSSSILLSLLCTVIPFITVTVFVIRVNEEVVSTLKLFIQGIIQEKDASSECHSTHILYMTNHLMAPVSLTGCGFFTINKAFVLTIIGTVLTYTLVLYGID